ncbi:primosomal protein N' [Candidatus Bealeia paramacronuclearis]|uniref:replication restart helicase PriA n=1 Tax=Candidatus Bealeia paramacronuclearis TaxID=1921001 RepID=UPI002F260D2B
MGKVLIPRPFEAPFDYLIPDDLEISPGSWVKVPFGRSQIYALLWEIQEDTVSPYKLKTISEVLEFPPIAETMLKFLNKMAEYTMSPLGSLLKLVIPQSGFLETPKRAKHFEFGRPDFEKEAPTLSFHQAAASAALKERIQGGQYTTVLLDGVTGSGKTEVYFEAIREALKLGGQILVLLPEIALTSQLLSRFQDAFGVMPAVWHSDVGAAQKRETWQGILKGEVSVLVGARSALFLPFSNLKLIVVDEEHDGSYKQEEGVIYSARDMAVLRAQFEKCLCILASATPSLETMMNVEDGKYMALSLPHRHGGAVMPSIELVDMRKLKEDRNLKAEEWISPTLQEALTNVVSQGQQAMLFLNRRGYAPMTLCTSCGERILCTSCETTLVHHKGDGKLHCHHCEYAIFPPKHCPACNKEDTLLLWGPGVERVHEELHAKIPEVRSLIMTSDTVKSPKTLEGTLQKIHGHEVDVVIGTQMIAKGHHFPRMTLVGVLDGDAGLSGADLRASEKTYQMLHQVSGRSGRDKEKGRVILQTYSPEHPVILALKDHDRAQFLALEKVGREALDFPPYGRLISIVLSGSNLELVEKTMRSLAKSFPSLEGCELLGPAPATLSYLKSKYRWRLLIQSPRNLNIQRVVQKWLKSAQIPPILKLQVDVDPYSFY